MDREVRSGELFILGQPDAYRFFQTSIDKETAGQGEKYRCQRAAQLGQESDPPHAAEKFLAENSGCNSSPRTDYPVQRPDAEHVIDLELFLLDMKAVDEDHGSDTPGDEGS